MKIYGISVRMGRLKKVKHFEINFWFGQEILKIVPFRFRKYYYNPTNFNHCYATGILEVLGLFIGWIKED